MALTPMMRQYLDLKEKHPGELLFFRLGDFYEMFFDDAVLASKELELTLTGKDCGLEERAPMCGVPYHAVNSYVARLIEKGYRVAICEQLEDPALAKGLVERDVTRIITPGTVTDPAMLQEKKENFILAACVEKGRVSCAFCEVTTGRFAWFTCDGDALNVRDELALIAPSEIIVNDREEFAKLDAEDAARAAQEEGFSPKEASACLARHFSKPAASLGFGRERGAVCAAGALIAYLERTQRISLSHITQVEHYAKEEHMLLDRAAAESLELTETVRAKSRRGSLLWILDNTRTAMGARLLRDWIEHPLCDRDAIEERLRAVEAFIAHPMEADDLRERIAGVYDLERLIGRIAYDSVNARDLTAIRLSLEEIPRIRELARRFGEESVSSVADGTDALEDFAEKLRRAIADDAPLSVRDGGMIAPGYSAQLDELRDIARNGRDYISRMEARERESTGIRNLKIGYNRVFGYYIEVSRSFLGQVPERYTRKQTLANAERFVTEELKDLETRILGAQESAVRLEYTILCELREELAGHMEQLRRNAFAVKKLDALLSLAEAAVKYDYVRPRVNSEGRLSIRDGRHPVVERSLGREGFVPNDTEITDESRMMIITGPNMAGKSTYMRQVALIVLMAHVGSFVPASEADIPLTDRIFTRIGASDDLYGGQSTFMVEMSEMAVILRHATHRSLVILDEIGRGTSTFDGLAIAWAAVEQLSTGNRCRTLFATHYHELSELEGALDGVVNYRITAKEMGEDVVFLRKIVPGGADRSYGVAVAKLAGLPPKVISRARQIMARLNAENIEHGSIGRSILDGGKKPAARQLSMEDYRPMQLVQELASLDPMSMTPMEALNRMFELNEKAKNI